MLTASGTCHRVMLALGQAALLWCADALPSSYMHNTSTLQQCASDSCCAQLFFTPDSGEGEVVVYHKLKLYEDGEPVRCMGVKGVHAFAGS